MTTQYVVKAINSPCVGNRNNSRFQCPGMLGWDTVKPDKGVDINTVYTRLAELNDIIHTSCDCRFEAEIV